MSTMPKKTTSDNKETRVVSVSLEGDELTRFYRVFRRVKERNEYMSKSDVLKELAGIKTPKNISEDDRRILRGESEKNISAKTSNPKRHQKPSLQTKEEIEREIIRQAEEALKARQLGNSSDS